MEKILSIVVPSYNIEKYINQCLDSFVISSVLEDIEILIVNDGSKDLTPVLAKAYEEKYPKTFKVINKANGGHGSTLNKGMELASGKYFKVVDGDDWVLEDGFIHLIEFLKHVDSDIVYHNYIWFDDNTKKVSHEFNKPFGTVAYKKEYSFDEIASQLYLKMHGMVYKTSILQQNDIVIDEHRFYVDSEYILLPIPYINTISFIEDDIYVYRLGLGGQSMNIKSMQRNISHHLGVIERLLEFYVNLERENISLEKFNYIERGIARLVASQFKIYLSFPDSKERKQELLDFDGRIKGYAKIYDANMNQAVRVLRKSKFSMYRIASWVLRMKLGIK